MKLLLLAILGMIIVAPIVLDNAFGAVVYENICNTLKEIPSKSWKLFLCSTVEINEDVDGITLDNTDHFGDSVANIGDLDGDGVNDLAVGAKRDDGGSTDAGSLYILFMNKGGSVKSTAKIEDDNSASGPELAREDRFGDSVVNIGDLNGDGIDDLAVGAPNDDTKSNGQGFAEHGDNNWDAGAVYILFLNRDGSLARETVVIDASTRDPDYGPALAKGDAFGMGVANIGDLDGNGYDDLAVGAMLDHNNNRGAVHILFMDENGGLAKATEKIDWRTTNGPTLGNGYWFGGSVANIGDFDGNGYDDLAVGSNLSPGGGSVATGAVYILFMDEDPGNGLAKATVVIDDTTTNGPTLSDDDRFGSSVANMGDIDGNGVNDLVVGARGDDEGGSWTGAVHILFLNSDGSVEETIEINSSTDKGPTLSAGDAFGTGLAHIGDLNGDGVNDLFVGTNLDDGGGSDRGVVHILLLTSEIKPSDGQRNLNPHLTDEILVSVGPNKAIVTDTDYLPNIQIQKGDSITITLNVVDEGPVLDTNTFYGQSDIESVSLYTNFDSRPSAMNLYYANHFNSDGEVSKTFYEWNANKDNVVYDFTKSVEWHNPVVRTAQFDTSTDDSSTPAEDKLTITFYSTWNDVMPKSEIIVKVVDSDMGYSKTTLPFTLQVGEYDQSYEDLFGTSTDYRFVPLLSDFKVRESIEQWVDPSSEMSDEQFTQLLGIQETELPSWVKNNLAQWVVEDKIDLADLIIAIEYLINVE